MHPKESASSFTVPTLYMVIILSGAVLVLSLIINGCLICKLKKNKKGYQITPSTASPEPTNTPDTTYAHISTDGPMLTGDAITNEEVSQTTQDGEYMEVFDK